MMDAGGKYPETRLWDAVPVLMNPDGVSKRNFLASAVKPSKVIFMFQGDISTIRGKIYVPRGGEAVLRLIQAYAVDHANGLCAYRHYAFRRVRAYDTYGGLSVVMYVRCGAPRALTRKLVGAAGGSEVVSLQRALTRTDTTISMIGKGPASDRDKF